jgi:hypothetical protein
MNGFVVDFSAVDWFHRPTTVAFETSPRQLERMSVLLAISPGEDDTGPSLDKQKKSHHATPEMRWLGLGEIILIYPDIYSSCI